MIVRVLVALALIGISAPAAAVAQDADHLTALARDFAPRIVVREQKQDCGPGEPFQPTTVEDVLGRDDVHLDEGSTTTPAPTAAELPGRPDAHLDYPGDPLNPGCGYEQWSNEISADTTPTVYAHMATDSQHPNKLALQYWFYWVYNDWNDRHEGDWEMIQLVFDATTPAEALKMEPQSVAYAQHEGSEVAQWNDPRLRRDGNHPVVYPAQGSHAAYFYQSQWFGKSAAAGFGCDNTSVTHEVPGAMLEPAVQLLDVGDPQFAWLAFEGRWGEEEASFNNGPTGPERKRQWTEPIAWQQEEGRSGAVAIPPVPGPAVSAFCYLSTQGSLLFIQILDQPTVTIAVLIALLLVLVALVRATRWRGADVTNYDRERTSGQMLSAAVRIYGGRLRVFAGLGGVFLAATWLLQLLREAIASAGGTLDFTDTQGTTSLLRSAGANFVSLVLQGSVLILFVTACIAVVAAPHGSVGVLEALRRSIAPPTPAVVVGGTFLVVALMAVSVFLLPLGLWLIAQWGTAGPAAMTEGLSFFGALRRSRGLTQQRRLRTLALTLFLLVVAIATGPLIGALLLLLTGLPFGLVNAVVVLCYAVLLPVFAISLTLQFYDLRQEYQRDAQVAV